MVGFGINEMRCLTNAVVQSCMRDQLTVTEGVPPLVRRIIKAHDIPLCKVRKVTLHQCPQEGGYVQYILDVITTEGQWSEKFQATRKKEEHEDFLLYDVIRDGVAEFLHLQH